MTIIFALFSVSYYNYNSVGPGYEVIHVSIFLYNITVNDDLLLTAGGRIILACRNVDKAQNVANEIKILTNNDDLVVRKLDLSSLNSIKSFVKEIEESK